MRKAASFRRSMTRRFVGIVLALAVGLLAFGALNAQAGLITDFAGNTQPVFTNAVGSPTGVAGFINFAVFDRTGGTPGDSFDTGVANADALLSAAGFHPNDAFLYLFQDHEPPDESAHWWNGSSDQHFHRARRQW